MKADHAKAKEWADDILAHKLTGFNENINLAAAFREQSAELARLWEALAKSIEREKVIEAELEAERNAEWLTQAHMLCTDCGIEQGHIFDRILKLRECIEAERKTCCGHPEACTEPLDPVGPDCAIRYRYLYEAECKDSELFGQLLAERTSELRDGQLALEELTIAYQAALHEQRLANNSTLRERKAREGWESDALLYAKNSKYHEQRAETLATEAEQQLLRANQEQGRRIAAERRLHEVREIYTGMEGFEPVTAPEGYLLRITRQMYDAAINEEKK